MVTAMEREKLKPLLRLELMLSLAIITMAQWRWTVLTWDERKPRLCLTWLAILRTPWPPSWVLRPCITILRLRLTSHLCNTEVLYIMGKNTSRRNRGGKSGRNQVLQQCSWCSRRGWYRTCSYSVPLGSPPGSAGPRWLAEWDSCWLVRRVRHRLFQGVWRACQVLDHTEWVNGNSLQWTWQWRVYHWSEGTWDLCLHCST